MRPLWLYPLLFAIERGCRKTSEIVALIGSNSSTVKKLIYFARKFKLIDNEMNLTDEGKRMLSSFEVLWFRRGRMAVKGRDGCFIIFIRKKGVKALRVPCDKALEKNKPSDEGKGESSDRADASLA